MRRGFAPIIIIIAVAIIAALGGYIVLSKKSFGPGGQVACTQEAKLCPDGTAVGRTGPNCEFAACPGAMPSSVAHSTSSGQFETDVSNWKTYRNEKYGFEVMYPSLFSIQEKAPLGLDHIQTIYYKEHKGNYIEITTLEKDDGQPFIAKTQDSFSRFVEQRTASGGGVVFVRRVGEFNNYRAIFVEMKYERADLADLTEKEIYLYNEKNGFVYSLFPNVFEEDVPGIKSIASQILSTFKFINNQ